MFDGDVTPGCRVVREGDVAGGVDVRRRGTHVGADDDARVVDLQARVLGESTLRAHTRRGEHEVTVNCDAVVQPDGTVVDGVDSDPADVPGTGGRDEPAQPFTCF